MPDTTARDEVLRQQTLTALQILDTAPEDEFDAVVKAARRIFGCRTSFISFIDSDRQWFKAREGTDLRETPRDCSICAIAVEQNREILVEDLQAHPQFSQNPAIADTPELRFYASIPLAGPTIGEASAPIGTLCVIDDHPRTATSEELSELRQLALVIESLLRTRLDAKLSRIALAERRALIDNLHRTHRQFELAEQMAQIGHWRLDLNTDEVFWSKQTCAIHGVESADDEVLKHALEFYMPHDRARLETAIRDCRETGKPYDLELDFRDAKGVLKRVRTQGEVEILNGDPVAMIGVFQDITDRYHLETRLRTAAHVDDLTGLPNRARLNQYLDDAITSSCKAKKPLALLLIDLDRFKETNDVLGHEAGDKVLKEVASQLVSEPFVGQFSARLGGDEFVMVIEKEELLIDLQSTLATLLGRLTFAVGRDDDSLTVSATIGATWLTDNNNERSALLRCADHALYQAKRAERGTASICPDAIAGDRVRAAPHLRAVG